MYRVYFSYTNSASQCIKLYSQVFFIFAKPFNLAIRDRSRFSITKDLFVFTFQFNSGGLRPRMCFLIALPIDCFLHSVNPFTCKLFCHPSRRNVIASKAFLAEWTSITLYYTFKKVLQRRKKLY